MGKNGRHFEHTERILIYWWGKESLNVHDLALPSSPEEGSAGIGFRCASSPLAYLPDLMNGPYEARKIAFLIWRTIHGLS